MSIETDEKSSARMLKMYSQCVEALEDNLKPSHKEFVQKFLDLVDKMVSETKEPIERVESLSLIFPFLCKAVFEYAPGSSLHKFSVYMRCMQTADSVVKKTVLSDLMDDLVNKKKDRS